MRLPLFSTSWEPDYSSKWSLPESCQRLPNPLFGKRECCPLKRTIPIPSPGLRKFTSKKINHYKNKNMKSLNFTVLAVVNGASHSVFESHPKKVAELIIKAANQIKHN